MSRRAATVSADQLVFTPGYLTSAKGADVLKRLEATLSTLRGVVQSDNDALPPGLENVASALLTAPILKSKSKVMGRGGSAVWRRRGGSRC